MVGLVMWDLGVWVAADKVVGIGLGRGGLGCVAAEINACLDNAEFVFVVFLRQIEIAFETAGG